MTDRIEDRNNMKGQEIQEYVQREVHGRKKKIMTGVVGIYWQGKKVEI